MIKITKIKKHKDGSATLDIEYNPRYLNPKIKSKRKASLTKGGTGIPYEDAKYPEEFFRIRPKIHKKYNYTCQLCNQKSKQLNVHHIDYNKQNNYIGNLITLCQKCNLRVNYNRDYWFAYFMYITNQEI